METNMTISLCDLELNLMIAVARQRYIPLNEEDETLELDIEAIDIGLELGNRNIGLSATMREVLDHIKLLDVSVYNAFVYAYHGSLKVN
ncbi:hypothetical protein I6Y99_005111 [Vibrio parahaemolyticus]|uniref:hypothetical protein n=1 Tax=Vibrio harveyi group TaxID=717610 RepID=UPI000A3B217D|nr:MULTISPECIES: hypothetical protein [Vibrio harveyi group]EGQ7796018.1 hypothetical protein [Vibrio parahaemolyticus]EGQ7811041.1 hypothetical protein [Vibrio parahaemolyticus]MDG2809735.1 hypothetical protein [Vibrio parahaemolyticus]OUJ22804.1 hypothetical protein BTO19_24020 [Vibrio parahaemolyticus]HBC3530923.1 hypothetical protein [Vibrio parahaemolyticus]